MLKKHVIYGLSLAVVAVAGYNTPVFGHGNSSSSPAGLNTVLRGVVADLPDQGSYVNYETPHVHPLDISPDGTKLAAVNTPGGYVEIFNINGTNGSLTLANSIRVGVDPVTARWRTNSELWVINQISDSISVIDVDSGTLSQSIITYLLADGDSDSLLEGSPNGDEPADVAFVTISGDPYAYVSCSRTDTIQIYDLDVVSPAPYIFVGEYVIEGEDPRMLASNANYLYAAIFESGNSTTLIAGENGTSAGFPPNDAARNDLAQTDHPYYTPHASYNAVNPAPNDGTWNSDLSSGISASDLGDYNAHGKSIAVLDMLAEGVSAPSTSIIVRKDFDDGDKWKDDNGVDWTRYISGDRASQSGRVSGWDMLDNDIYCLTLDGADTETYAERLMNICMAVEVIPAGDNAGNVIMVGIDSTNEIRFEPNLTGTFVRVMMSITDPDGDEVLLIDLNEAHLDAAQAAQHGGGETAYFDGSVPQADRDDSIGDPRGIAVNPAGTVAYITGMGSNNVIGISLETGTLGQRSSVGHTMEVGFGLGFGPTGVKHHPTLDRLYVLNKFASSISVFDTTTFGSESLVYTSTFYDPTPDYINEGRVHFYGTHENSGLGQLACASCHIDGRMDRLAWDLGNPAAITDESNDFPTPADAFFGDILGVGDGLITGSSGTNPDNAQNTLVNYGETEADFEKFHPMKGPMTTQTLVDIIGKEPHHWRGDKDGIEEFAGAFDGLQGDDQPLPAMEMQEFENFLSSLHFSPNPYRLLDNSLAGGPTMDDTCAPCNLPLDMTGFFTAIAPANPELFSPSGTPFEDTAYTGGDAWAGFNKYVDQQIDSIFRCVDCHTLPMGAGSTQQNTTANVIPFAGFVEIPPGANGEAHQMIVSLDGTGQPHIKIPQTRNQLDKEGFYLDQVDPDGVGGGGHNIPGAPTISRAGFGVLHDGSVDGVVRFLSENAFEYVPGPGNDTDQDIAEIVAFTLSINGDDFDTLKLLTSAADDIALPNDIPPAANDQTAHAGVGSSTTVSATLGGASDDETKIFTAIKEANRGSVGLVAYGTKNGEERGWQWASGTGLAAVFNSDREGETDTTSDLFGYSDVSGAEITFMLVPLPATDRIGTDRDEDNALDGDEAAYNTDNANSDDHKWVDEDFVGASNGSASMPYTSFATAVANAVASPGKNRAIHLEAGTYNEGGTYNVAMVLLAEGGVVTLNP